MHAQGEPTQQNATTSVVLVGPSQSAVHEAGGVDDAHEGAATEAETGLEAPGPQGGEVNQSGADVPVTDTEDDGDDEYMPSENEDDEEEEGMDTIKNNEQHEEVQPLKPQEMGVGKRRYDCTQCGKTFNKASLLREHTKTHAG